MGRPMVRLLRHAQGGAGAGERRPARSGTRTDHSITALLIAATGFVPRSTWSRRVLFTAHVLSTIVRVALSTTNRTPSPSSVRWSTAASPVPATNWCNRTRSTTSDED
jgi:hypothetical protein